MKNGSFARRIGYAVAGWRIVWRNERSFRTQVVAGSCAAVGLVASPSALWTAVLLLTGGLVLALECVNAALEYLADTLHPDIAPGIGAAKDAAAGGVLIAGVTAIGVAIAYGYSVFSYT